MEKEEKILGKCMHCNFQKGKNCFFPSVGFRIRTEAGVDLTCVDLLVLYDYFKLIGLLKKNGGFNNELDQ